MHVGNTLKRDKQQIWSSFSEWVSHAGHWFNSPEECSFSALFQVAVLQQLSRQRSANPGKNV